MPKGREPQESLFGRKRMAQQGFFVTTKKCWVFNVLHTSRLIKVDLGVESVKIQR